MSEKKRKRLIGRILEAIGNAIASLFSGLDKVTKKLVPIAKEVVNNVKLIDATGITDVLTKLIPGTADDAIVAKLREFIPKFLNGLNIAEQFANITDPSEKLRAILLKIQSSTSSEKKMFYTGFAAQLLEVLDDGKLTYSEYVQLTNWYYENEHLLKLEEDEED